MNDIVTAFIHELESGKISEADIAKVVKLAKLQKNAVTKIAPKTKGYSEENVLSMVRMISAGHTSDEIISKVFPTVRYKYTLRAYLEKHYSRKGYVKKYWDKLVENDRNARIKNVGTEAETEVETEEEAEVETEEEAEVETETEVKEETETESEAEIRNKYVLDPYFVIDREGREYWSALINKLEATNSDYLISEPILKNVARTYTFYASEFAAMVLSETDEVHLVNSMLPIQELAMAEAATVITFSKRTAEVCSKYVKVIMVEDYLA